jgi:hypothetical protein
VKSTLAASAFLIALTLPAMAQTPAPSPTTSAAVVTQSTTSDAYARIKPGQRRPTIAPLPQDDLSWRNYLTVQQQQDAYQRMLDATFHIDHSS